MRTNSAIKYLTLYNTKLPPSLLEAIFSEGSFSQLQMLILGTFCITKWAITLETLACVRS